MTSFRCVELAYTLTADTDQELLPENPQRSYALIVNDGANDAYLRLGQEAAVKNRGIRINNGGGNYEINSTNLWKGAIHVISAGTPVITVVEW